MSDKIDAFVIRSVCQELGVQSLPYEHAEFVLGLFKSMNPDVFKGYKLSQLGPILGKILGAKLKKRVTYSELDIKEFQKKALGSADQSETDDSLLRPTLGKTEKTIAISSFLGINDLDEIKMLLNPESLYVHYYLVLDSDFRDRSAELSTAITRFTWKYAPTQFTGQGFCNTVGTVRDIIGMRLYQPRIPNTPEMNTDAKRISVQVEEFKAQSFIAENGFRFHFLLRPNFAEANTSVELSTEDYNDGIFNFRTPITEFSTFTLLFGNPLNTVVFSEPFDRFIVAFELVCYKTNS